LAGGTLVRLAAVPTLAWKINAGAFQSKFCPKNTGMITRPLRATHVAEIQKPAGRPRHG